MKHYRTLPYVKDKIIQLKEEGLENDIISERMGVGIETVRHTLRMERQRKAKELKARKAKRKKAHDEREKLWDRITKRSASKCQ